MVSFDEGWPDLVTADPGLYTDQANAGILMRSHMDKRLIVSVCIAFCIPGAIRLLDAFVPFIHLFARPFGLTPSLIVIPMVGVVYALTFHRWIMSAGRGTRDSRE